MTMTGLDSIDTTLHKTNQWLAGVMVSLGTDDRKKAYAALRSVLHALRDRFPVATVAGLGAQLPMLVRGIYYDGWRPHLDGRVEHVHTVEEFLAVVDRELPAGMALDPERAVRAVLRVVEQHLDPNETSKIVRLLPRALHELWGNEVEARDS